MSALGNILGVRMNLMIGPSPVALPMPMEALEAIDELEIKLSDKGPSGFKLVLNAGRNGPLDFLETPFVDDPRFMEEARIIVTMIFDVKPTVIFDGLVTKRHVLPGDRPNEGKLVLLGRDLSFAMNKEVKRVQYPALDESLIATLIAASYAQFLMVPLVTAPKSTDFPNPIDRVPQQNCSDWAYLNRMARRHGYETYVQAGPVPGMNQLYWGPPVGPGMPQGKIVVNSGPGTSAYNVTASHSAEDLTEIESNVFDPKLGPQPVRSLPPTQEPLGAVPEGVRRAGQVRKGTIETSGLNMAQAMARAQGKADESARDAITVTGTLNSVAYNGALRARDRVFLTGVGLSFDGQYKVAEVRHKIKPGSYEQDFVLTRSELGPKEPMAPLL
jgi:hypothetical protein